MWQSSPEKEARVAAGPVPTELVEPVPTVAPTPEPPIVVPIAGGADMVWDVAGTDDGKKATCTLANSDESVRVFTGLGGGLVSFVDIAGNPIQRTAAGAAVMAHLALIASQTQAM